MNKRLYLCWLLCMIQKSWKKYLMAREGGETWPCEKMKSTNLWLVSYMEWRNCKLLTGTFWESELNMWKSAWKPPWVEQQHEKNKMCLVCVRRNMPCCFHSHRSPQPPTAPVTQSLTGESLNFLACNLHHFAFALSSLLYTTPAAIVSPANFVCSHFAWAGPSNASRESTVF